uniref:WH2 domain-containing protein n=1 Tax=Heterorhabditis bacteriophora TaxID=37862 RepID=A0A1I7XNZ5_HETBA
MFPVVTVSLSSDSPIDPSNNESSLQMNPERQFVSSSVVEVSFYPFFISRIFIKLCHSVISQYFHITCGSFHFQKYNIFQISSEESPRSVPIPIYRSQLSTPMNYRSINWRSSDPASKSFIVPDDIITKSIGASKDIPPSMAVPMTQTVINSSHLPFNTRSIWTATPSGGQNMMKQSRKTLKIWEQDNTKEVQLKIKELEAAKGTIKRLSAELARLERDKQELEIETQLQQEKTEAILASKESTLDTDTIKKECERMMETLLREGREGTACEERRETRKASAKDVDREIEKMRKELIQNTASSTSEDENSNSDKSQDDCLNAQFGSVSSGPINTKEIMKLKTNIIISFVFNFKNKYIKLEIFTLFSLSALISEALFLLCAVIWTHRTLIFRIYSSLFSVPIEQLRKDTQEMFPLNLVMFMVLSRAPEMSKALANFLVISHTCEAVSKNARHLLSSNQLNYVDFCTH